MKFSSRSLKSAPICWVNQLLAVLVLITLLTLLLKNWFAVLQCPFALSFEGHILWASWKIALGENIYSTSSIFSPPWTVMIYPPLYLVIGTLFAKVFGFTYSSLRLVTIISAGSAMVLSFVLFRKSGCSRLAALTGVMLFLSYTPVFIFSCLARCDIFALVLAIWGLERFLTKWQSSTPAPTHIFNYWPALGLLILSCFARQQSVVASLAIVVFLLCMRQRRLAVEFLSWIIAPIVGLCLAINTFSGGFFVHIFALRQAAWDWHLLEASFALLGHDAIKCILGLVILIAGLIRKKQIGETEKLPYALLLVSSVLLLYSQGLRGASSNHLIFTYLAFSWLVALNLAPASWSGIVILASSLIGIWDVAKYLPEKSRELLQSPNVAQQLPTTGSIVLSEDPYWAIKNNYQIEVVDPLTLVSIWIKQPQSLEHLRHAIAEKHYQALLINAYDVEHGGGNVWMPEIMTTINANYLLIGRLPGNGEMQYLFLPRSPEEGK